MDSGETPIKGFIESSFVDWPGKVAAVVFLPGCNFRCPFCHNGDLVLNPEIFEDFPLETVMAGIRENEGWLDGVVVTGGEPAISPSLTRLLGSLRETGLPLRLDTNGSRPGTIKYLIEQGLIDSVAMDVKAPLEPLEYLRAAGIPIDTGLVRESIEILVESGLEVSFRTTVVPGLHGRGEVENILKELMGRPLALQNFRPSEALDPRLRGIRPFSGEEFEALKAVADGRGQAAGTFEGGR